jgi:hypothetical protein
MRQVRNQPVSPNQLDYYREEGNISEVDLALTTECDIKKAQHVAYQNLKSLQAQHQELRESYLEGLAEAIVLDRAPQLDHDSLQHIKLDRKEKQLKQLIAREKVRRMYRKIGRVLGKTKGKGLSRIDIPDASAATETSGDPNSPKTWRGPWKSLTDPRVIAKEVCKINSDQYHQAHSTPFGSGPIADLFGRRGDTPSSEDLLRGTLPPNLPDDALPETIRILQTLAQQTPSSDSSSIISPEEYVASYVVANESTSSSPSGRYIGHYKAILKDPQLVGLHPQMMSIPFQMGFAPERW